MVTADAEHADSLQFQAPIAHEPAPAQGLSIHEADVPHETPKVSASNERFEEQKLRWVEKMRDKALGANKMFDPLDGAAVARTASLLQSLGRFDRVGMLAQHLTPQSSKDVEDLAQMFMQGGRPELAVELLDAVRAQETALQLAQARLLCGDHEAARRELAGTSESPDTRALLAMIEHSSGNAIACDEHLEDLAGEPALQIVVNLWRDRMDAAMQIVDAEFADLLENPSLDARPAFIRERLISSPFVIHAPCAPQLASDRRWQLLRDCARMPAELDSIEVRVTPERTSLVELTLQQVESALRQIGRGDVGQALAAGGISQLIPGARHFEFVGEHYVGWRDARIMSGVMLGDKGRELLAAHFARKYNASIVIHPQADPGLVIAGIVGQGRRDAQNAGSGGMVRQAHYFSAIRGPFTHGVAVLYAQEPGERPQDPARESLFFFDSVPDKETFATARREVARLFGASIPTFELAETNAALQRGRFTCWTHALKTSVALTRHTRDAQGQIGDDFPIPSLVDELQSCIVETTTRDGVTVNLVRPPREIAKLAQHPNAIPESELQRTLRDSLKGKTLGDAIQESTVAITHHDINGPRELHVLDYARQKGIRYAVLVQGLAYCQEIRAICRKAGLDWTTQHEDALLVQIKRDHQQLAGSRSNPAPLSEGTLPESDDDDDDDD